jgi:hypothetical protein
MLMFSPKLSSRNTPEQHKVQHSQLQNSSTPQAQMLDFSMYQSGIDFKRPYSSRPLKPSTP